MAFYETKRAKYAVLRAAATGVFDTADDTDIDIAGTDSTCDFENKPSAAVLVPEKTNAVTVIFSGYHTTATDDKTMTWALYAYRDKGPCEYIANGTATLGTQPVDSDVSLNGSSGGSYADTIAITSQKWLQTVSVVDSGNNRIAKLMVDLCGCTWLLCKMTKNSSCTGFRAEYSYF